MSLINIAVMQTTSTPGTGTFDLEPAPSGWRNFLDAYDSGDTVYYVARTEDNLYWEIGHGVITAGSPVTLSRTVIESSNGNALVNFPAESKFVYVALPPSRAVYMAPDADGATAVHKNWRDVLAGDITALVKMLTSSALSGQLFAAKAPPELMNDTLDPANDIILQAGTGCFDLSTGAYIPANAQMTKRTDALWTKGHNGGCWDTGSKTALGEIYFWLISDGTDTDLLASASATAPLMPGGWTAKRLIGAFVLEAGGALPQFVQADDEILFKAPIANVTGVTIGATASNLTFSVPQGIVCKAIVVGRMSNATNGFSARISSMSANDASVTSSNSQFVGTAGVINATELQVLMVKTNLIRARSNQAGTTVTLGLVGYTFNRGRAA